MAGKVDKSSVDAYWPCDLPEYSHRVEEGLARANKLRLVICGLVRDCEEHLPRTFLNMDRTGSLFKSWRGVLFENDSKDRSPAMLREWATLHPEFVAETLVRGERSWPMKRLPDRGTALARYRNRCRDLVLQHFPHFDLVMVLDTDLFGWSINGIFHSLSYWGEWDAMLSNGLREDKMGWVQYDAWAIRDGSWSPKLFEEVKNDVYAMGSPLVPVWSAFGGLGLYTMEGFKAAGYDGGDCEHVGFHKNLREEGFVRMFINPNMKTMAIWRRDESMVTRVGSRLRRVLQNNLALRRLREKIREYLPKDR